MKKLLIVFAVLLFPVSAFAEWTYIGFNGDTFAYVDYSTLSRKGDFVKIWVDIRGKPKRHPQGFTYDREISYIEFDCVQKKYRELDYTAFLERTYVYRADLSRWGYVPPNTLYYTAMIRACPKWKSVRPPLPNDIMDTMP